MARPQKSCAICESGVRVVDFKDERLLTRFLTERGKILPSRLSGTCARHQRQAEHRNQAGAPGGVDPLHQGIHRLTIPSTTPASSGRRSQFLLLLATAVFLLAAVQVTPVFFLGLFAALLLVSRPRSVREWLWIMVCGAALAAGFRGPASLADHTVRASAAFFIGAFVVLTLLGIRSFFTRASVAVVIAAAAMVGWYLLFHLRFVDLQNEIVTQTWETFRQIWTDLPEVMPSGDALNEGAVADTARQLASALSVSAVLFPAWIALAAMASARLVWSWYQRIARTPILPDVAPFRDFRFNDHLVWLLVLLIALLLAPVPPAVALAAGNTLVVLASIYVLRGAAIARTSLRRASPFFIGVLLLIMLPFCWIYLIGLALLGIADTWLDFRRRVAPPSGVSS